MIKVLHVVHTMECGGIETMLMNVYRNIDRENFKFDFLVNGSADNYYTDEIIKLGGSVIGVTPKRVNFFRNIKETLQVMKNGKYDIVHIHQDSMISPAIWCAKRAGIKKIITHAHTTNVDCWYRKLATYFGRFYINKNADLKFACSAAAASWIYGEHANDYILFKNAIDASKVRFSKDNYYINRKKFNINDNTFVIGTCGRLSVEKNQKFLVEIFAEIKKLYADSKLILIGDGVEKENLIVLAKSLNVLDDIYFTGMVSNVDYYYSILDCFVLPSFYEGLPLVGIEAQAAGIPSFFSTGVTEEVKIIKNVWFFNISDGAKHWCDEILNNRCNKFDSYEDIKNAGYDIGYNVKMLEEFYKNILINRCD